MSHHPNFVGVPTREDTQPLEQLRRQLLGMIGVMDKLYFDMMNAAHAGGAINWPHIRHNISLVNSYLSSINGYINGEYKHSVETMKDSEGHLQPVYRDKVVEGQASRIAALHVYPQAPYPLGDERLASMALTLLDKRLGGPEEKWVEDRLRKAAEFAHVPSEWGIEPRKAAVKDKDAEESDDEDLKDWYEKLPTQRIKGTLNEDEYVDLWTNGHRTAFDRDYCVRMRFGMEDDEEVGKGADQDMEDGGGDGEEGEDEGDEYEDEDDAGSPKPPPPPPVVMIQRAAPAVHKPVPGVPVMALGVVHRFMSSGEVQQPSGQR